MKTSNVWKLLAVLIVLAAGARAGEMHDTVTNYRGYVLAPWAPVVAPASITNTAGGAFPATGTWHYALAAQNSLGISGAGPVTNVTVATGNLVRITWRPAGGATNYLIYRGTVATSLTERAVVGLSTSYVDHGTNAWTTNSPASTITNVPALILAGAATDPLGAVTKAQAEALIAVTDAVTMATMVASNAVLTAGITNAHGVASQALVRAAASLTNNQTGVTLAGTFSGNGAGLSNVLMATALTNGGFTIGGQSVTNGGEYNGSTDTNAVQRTGDTNLVGSFAWRRSASASLWAWYGSTSNLYPLIFLTPATASGNRNPILSLAISSTIISSLAVDTNAATRGTWGSLGRMTSASSVATIWDSENDGSSSLLDAGLLGGQPAASYALLSSFVTVARYTNFPATATAAGAAGQWAVTNVGSTNWLAVWGENFQGTGTNGWGFIQLQRARP